jgi:hypothetical protein
MMIHIYVKQMLLQLTAAAAVASMDTLHSIADNCDVAAFDQVVVIGSEIKRLLPGEQPFARRT